jgi:hypothetical protein
VIIGAMGYGQDSSLVSAGGGRCYGLRSRERPAEQTVVRGSVCGALSARRLCNPVPSRGRARHRNSGIEIAATPFQLH